MEIEETQDEWPIRCASCYNRTGLNAAQVCDDGLIFCARCAVSREMAEGPAGLVELVGA